MTSSHADHPARPMSLTTLHAGRGAKAAHARQALARGGLRREATHLETACDVLRHEKAQRVLVLSLDSGQAAAGRLHEEGLDVAAVDCAASAVNPARIGLRKVGLETLASEPMAFVRQAPSASFDALLADVQGATGAPDAYFAAEFWEDVKRVLRRGGLVLVCVSDELHAVRLWGPFQRALASAGFTAMVVSERYACGSRLLVTTRAR